MKSRTFLQIQIDELKRLQFIYKRDGAEATLLFAKQAITVYKKALKTPLRSTYRQEYLGSILVCRFALRNLS